MIVFVGITVLHGVLVMRPEWGEEGRHAAWKAGSGERWRRVAEGG
jgi:hypothetical protein